MRVSDRQPLQILPTQEIMPGLKSGRSSARIATSPLEAAHPAPTRRRVWRHPDLTSHGILVLTFDRISLSSDTHRPKPELIAAIEAGGDLDQLLGALAVVIDLASVRRLRLHLQTNSIMIEYVGHGQGKSRQRVTFATPEAADACFTKIWRRLGHDVELVPYRSNSWSMARAPLGLFLGALIVTAALALMLNIFQDMSSVHPVAHASTQGVGELGSRVPFPKSALGKILAWLDWRVVCGLGGVVAAVSQVWLYRRLTTPPACLELIRS